MLLGLLINSANDALSPRCHWPCLDPRAQTIPTGPTDGSICLSQQLLCLVFQGQEAVNAQQGRKGLTRDTTGTPSAPQPHSLLGQQPWLQVIPAMGQPVSALPGLAGNAGAAPSLCLVPSLCLATGMRAPHEEPGWLVPNFLFLFTEP